MIRNYIRKTYLFLQKPWAKGFLSICETFCADAMAVSGIGITTSMEVSSEGKRAERIVEASFEPMFSRERATEILSRIESGRAK